MVENSVWSRPEARQVYRIESLFPLALPMRTPALKGTIKDTPILSSDSAGIAVVGLFV
jgi:hypothetical protein